MTKILYLCITLLLCILATSANPNLCLTETCAKPFMETVNSFFHQNAAAYRRLPNADFSAEMVVGEEVKKNCMQIMQEFDWQHFQDPQLKRQFEVLVRDEPIPYTDASYQLYTQILENVGKQKFACLYESPDVCPLAFVKDIKPIITNDKDLNVLKWYWTEWRNKLPTQVKDGLRYFIKYWQSLATPQKPASAFWYSGYEDGNFLHELEMVMETIQPFYKQLHAQLRQALRAKYGEDIISSDGLIPHHLMEQAMYQAWKKDSLLQNPFPNKKLPNLQQELNGLHFVPLDLVKIAGQFFTSLGFDGITDEFMHEHFSEKKSGEGGPDCKSRILTYGEIELNYCPKVNYKKLLTTHGDVAHIEYAILKNKLGVGLSQEACPGFGNAFAEAVILSASTPKHLQQKLGLLLDYDYDDEQLSLNHLYREAVHAMLTVPFYFVHEKLWVDMIDNKISESQYNCHYWNLMEKYMGVGPSAQTDANTFDMPYKFYEGILDQNRSTKKLFGEFLGYQIYRDICAQIGEYQPGNAAKTLHHCDFANNKPAGAFLKNMMSAGSSKPWREIIKPLSSTHNTNLTGTAFLEYFQPLHVWLKSKDLPVGWTSIQHCH